MAKGQGEEELAQQRHDANCGVCEVDVGEKKRLWRKVFNEINRCRSLESESRGGAERNGSSSEDSHNLFTPRPRSGKTNERITLNLFGSRSQTIGDALGKHGTEQ